MMASIFWENSSIK